MGNYVGTCKEFPSLSSYTQVLMSSEQEQQLVESVAPQISSTLAVQSRLPSWLLVRIWRQHVTWSSSSLPDPYWARWTSIRTSTGTTKTVATTMLKVSFITDLNMVFRNAASAYPSPCPSPQHVLSQPMPYFSCRLGWLSIYSHRYLIDLITFHAVTWHDVTSLWLLMVK